MVIGRWLCRVSLNICSDLEEVFTYPFKLSQNCFETRRRRRNSTKGGGGGGSSTKKSSVVTVDAKIVGLMDVLGLLRIRVRRGINLAVRDTLSSDPYCVVSCGTQVSLLIS